MSASAMNQNEANNDEDGSDIADEDLVDPSTVIEPPAEMKLIIEKTVSFVVKNGIGFESKVRESQRSNRKFDFINVGHPFHNYYKQKYQTAKYSKARILAQRYQQQKDELHATQQDLLGLTKQQQQQTQTPSSTTTTTTTTAAASHVITHRLTLKQRIMQELALAKKAKSAYIAPPRHARFAVPLPTKRVTAYEMDVIKLVAQFTACIGPAFIRDLKRGEPDNETFGFLSPMHPRFQCFQRLVDAYACIIDHFEDYKDTRHNSHRRHGRSSRRDQHPRDRSHSPSSPAKTHEEHAAAAEAEEEEEEFVTRFKSLNLDRDRIWCEAIGSAEWSNREKEKDAKFQRDEENERRANALIDWQSFTVLETIDFEAGDERNTQLVPPGHSIEEIDAILDTTMDVQAELNEPILAHDDEEDMDLASSDEEDEADGDGDGDKEEEEMRVDVEMEAEHTQQHKKEMAKAKVAVKLKSQPMPAPKGVIVSTDLDIVPTVRMETDDDVELRLKLEKILQDSSAEQLERQQCPICQEYINIAHLSQHIRIELLDPKWKEQKQALKVRLAQTTLASNQQITENLVRFSREHAAAAAQIGADPNTSAGADAVVPWDGHKGTVAHQKELQKQQKQQQQQAKNESQPVVPPQQQQQAQHVQHVQQQHLQQQQQPPQPRLPFAHPAHAMNQYLPPYAQPPPQAHHMGMIPPPHFRPPMAPPHPHAHAMAMPMPGVFAPPRPPPPQQPHHAFHHHPMPHRPPIHGHAPAPPPPPPQFMQMQPQMHTQPQAPQPPPTTTSNIAHEHAHEPPTKKTKLNDGSAVDGNVSADASAGAVPDGFMDEQAFIAANGGAQKTVKIRIKVPNDATKKQFQFNGQILTFTMKLSDAVTELKQRVSTVTTLAANKQKLKIQNNGLWLKDAASLAFYNLNGTQMLELHTRTRGGKKNKLTN